MDEPSVLGKVRRILDAFDDDAPALGLSALARRSGVPKATVHRLAGELVAWGLLERDGTAFRLGGRLFELGERVPRYRTTRDVALPFLEDLYVATGETVHLGVLDGREVLYLLKIKGHRGIDAPSRVAGRMPLHATASGKVLLAHSPPELLDRVLAADLARLTPHTITSPGLLREVVERVRRAGAATERDELLVGHGSAAAPVLAADGALVGALSVAAPLHRRSPQRLVPVVRTAALALSRALRQRPVTPP